MGQEGAAAGRRDGAGEGGRRDRDARGISPGAGEPGAIAVRAPSLAAVTMACASCSAVRSFWMPSRESIAPERLARNDRASLAGGGGVAGTCCCALGRAVRKSGERGGVGASEARRGSSMDSLRPFLGGSPSRSRNEPPRMQRTRGARVESGGGGNGGRLLGVGSVCSLAAILLNNEMFFQSRLSAPVVYL